MMAYARTSLRAEKRALREKMAAMGLGHREVAAELARRYQLRPRAAWREAHGWSLQEAADRINSHGGEAGLDPGGVAAMTSGHLCEYENFPGHGLKPSGRRPAPRLLALLAAVYGCAVTDLVDLADREHFPPGDLLVLDACQPGHGGVRTPAVETDPPAASALPALIPRAESTDPRAPSMLPTLMPQQGGADARASAGLAGVAARDVTRFAGMDAWPASPYITYRWVQEPVLSGSWIGREVEMAAHDGSEHAGRAEQRDIGDATLEQFRADVIRLSHDSMTSEPFPLFQEMRRVRERMHAALDRRLWPRDETDLYLLLGCLNCLMADLADALGYPHAAEELIRAGWAYAVVIGHKPLMAKLRNDLSGVAYWRGHSRQSRDLAESGIGYLASGPNAAELYLKYGRAAARLGDGDAARRAIGDAWDARDLPDQDDLLEFGGEFWLSKASQYRYVGSILLEIPGSERDAIAELERATQMYAAGPEEGETHSFEMRMLAHIDLAMARLRAGNLDGARPALLPVLALPPGKRIDPLPQLLEKVRDELARSPYHGSPSAGDLAGEIENFGRDTIVAALAALPG